MDLSYESGAFYQLTTIVFIIAGVYGVIKERKTMYSYGQVKPFIILGIFLFCTAVVIFFIIPGRWDYDHVLFILSLNVDDRIISYYRLFLAMSYVLLAVSTVSLFIVKHNREKGIDFSE